YVPVAAASQPQKPVGDGMKTQLVEDSGEGLDSTIALPDAAAADEIRDNVVQREQRQRRQQQMHAGDNAGMHDSLAQQSMMGQNMMGQPIAGQPMGHPGHQPAYAQGPMNGGGMYPPNPPMQQGSPQDNQAAIETKMSLPRPAAVAQWLMEQGDVE